MKIKTFERRPDINEIKLRSDRHTIWLTSKNRLIIQPGDRLGDVADVILDIPGWNLDRPNALGVAALWFALGERLADDRLAEPWNDHELRTNPNRRFRRKPRRVR